MPKEDIAGSSKDNGIVDRYITLDVKNFGPISRGKVDLRPLTVLIGTNGCGKSHIATLVHTIANMKMPKRSLRGVTGPSGFFDALDDEVKRLYREYKPGHAIDSNIYQLLVNIDLLKFKETMLRNFSKDENELIRIGKSGFKINMVSRTMNITYASGHYPTIQSPAITKVNCIKSRFIPENSLLIENDVAHVTIPQVEDSFNLQMILDSKLGLKYNGIIKEIKRSVYFPAERASMILGIMHRLNSEWMTEAFYPGFTHNTRVYAYSPLTDEPLILDYTDSLDGNSESSAIASPSLTNTMVSFLAWIIKIKNYKGSIFADHVDALENQMFCGKIVAEPSPTQWPKIFFKYKEKDMPLHTVASSIKSLAVFLLYVKYAAKQNELIILEEPEINLHPDNQLLLAKFIARLVNDGLHILITTHSPYFLEQLSHCVLSGMINNKKSSKILSDKESLKPDQVAVYTFTPNDGEYKIVPVITAPEVGIPQNEFTHTDDNLYEEVIHLRQADE